MFSEAVDRVGNDLRFLVEATRRGDVAIEDLNAALRPGRAIESLASTWLTEMARQIARRELHGDGGAGVLRERAGESKARARRRVKAAGTLDDMPQARRAVDAGEVSPGNAERLAEMARRATPEAVEADEGLLALAREMPVDRFAREADSWTQRHSDDHGRADYLRKRRRRYLRFWDKNGMTHLRGRFDPESGARIRGNIEQMAKQLRRADQQRARQLAKPDHSVSDGAASHAAGVGAYAAGGVAGSGGGVGGSGGGVAGSGGGVGGSGGGRGQALGTAPAGVFGTAGPALIDEEQRNFGQLMADALDRLAAAGAGADAGEDGSAGGRRKTEVIVVADLDAVTGNDPSGRCEIPGCGPIPPKVLERLLCDADLTGILFHKGQPLHHGATVRTATKAQWRALIARDGGCIGCGAAPGWCEAHHTVPFSLSRRTTIRELALVCWQCHRNIHDHNWQITKHHDTLTLNPPNPDAGQHNHNRSRPGSGAPGGLGLAADAGQHNRNRSRPPHRPPNAPRQPNRPPDRPRARSPARG